VELAVVAVERLDELLVEFGAEFTFNPDDAESFLLGDLGVLGAKSFYFNQPASS